MEGFQELSAHRAQPDIAPLRGSPSACPALQCSHKSCSPRMVSPWYTGRVTAPGQGLGGYQRGHGLAAWLLARSEEVLEGVPEGCQLHHRKPWLYFLLCYMMMCGL